MTENKEKFALVTGANGGIGQALCKTFKDEGYEVIATDLQDKPAESLTFSQYVSIDLNKLVENEAYATGKANEIKSFLPNGELHALINNAAIQILGGVDSLTRTDWNQTLNVNLQAPFLITQAFIRELEACKGAVVNISSIHAKLTKRNFVAYATSKAALSGMTRAMSVDLGPRVRINAIEPAAIETEMLKSGFQGQKEKYEVLERYHPSEELGKPKDLAKYAVFICGSQIDFMHGECVPFDGGISSVLHDPS